MNLGFWKNLSRPFFALAPMADVTDSAFRFLIAKIAKPDVFWTEFVSADGLCRAPIEGKKKLLKDLEFCEIERPIVAQLFGSKPEYIEEASRLCLELGFDGVDINMGCPDKTIEKQGAGAAMIKNPTLAKEIIRSAKRGAKTDDGGIPVSIKTRVGFNKVEIDSWIPVILEEGISAITVHARTRKEMSKVPAQWEHVKEVVEIRNKMQKDLPEKTLIIGNGDVKNIEEGIKRAEETGCDGIMIGRGIFGFPWRFRKDNFVPTIKEKLETMILHTKLFEEKLGSIKNFAVMKKHYKAYVEGFDGAKELRMKLMETENANQVEKIIKEFLSSTKSA